MVEQVVPEGEVAPRAQVALARLRVRVRVRVRARDRGRGRGRGRDMVTSRSSTSRKTCTPVSSRQRWRLMVAHWSCPVPQVCERKRCHLCPSASSSSGRLPVEMSLNVGTRAASNMAWNESGTARQAAPTTQAKRRPPIRNSSRYRRSYSSPASRVSATVLTWAHRVQLVHR